MEEEPGWVYGRAHSSSVGRSSVHEDQLIVNVGGDICVASFNKRTGELLENGARLARYSPACVTAELMGRSGYGAHRWYGQAAVAIVAVILETSIESILAQDVCLGQCGIAGSWKLCIITEAYTEGGALIEFAEDGSGSTRWKAGASAASSPRRLLMKAIYMASMEPVARKSSATISIRKEIWRQYRA